MPLVRRTHTWLLISLTAAATACGPSAREQELANQLDAVQTKLRELESTEDELRSALEQAQSNIDQANSQIRDVQFAAYGSCEQLRAEATFLDQIDAVDIP